MSWFVLKAVLSGLIVALVSEIARRNSVMAAFFASLPLVSILGMIWIWKETNDVERIARHSEATFWYVIPSLPMFLLLPLLLRAGMSFWVSLMVGSLVTAALYLLLVWLAPRLGLAI